MQFIKIFWDIHIFFRVHPTCLFITVFPITTDRSVPNIEFVLVMSCVVIGQLGNMLLLSTSFYFCSVGCPTIPCNSCASFAFSAS